MKRTCVVLVAALGLFGLASCQGKMPEPSKAGAAAQPAREGPQFDEQPAGSAPSDAKAPAGDAAGGPPDPPPVAAPDLGARFLDPPWFRKQLFPDATKVDFNRTKADANGFFTSNMRFFLPAGQTPEQCAKFLQEKIGAEVKNLESKKLDDGRYEIKGSTERYTVTMQCGAPKGELIAFVSYHWTA